MVYKLGNLSFIQPVMNLIPKLWLVGFGGVFLLTLPTAAGVGFRALFTDQTGKEADLLCCWCLKPMWDFELSLIQNQYTSSSLLAALQKQVILNRSKILQDWFFSWGNTEYIYWFIGLKILLVKLIMLNSFINLSYANIIMKVGSIKLNSDLVELTSVLKAAK